MFDHDLLALHLMRLHQHQQAYAGALADVRRCLQRPGAGAEVHQVLADLERRSAELANLIEGLEHITQ
ncbi:MULTISPECIES: hypothetical protein [unclassified Pseudomonas]|uniref:hypothetical protein n=1 Tax=unclassified Pseudomonas TaxID=196821 RepID=UPI001784EDC9|nr:MULTISPECIES: hypothetical protein [unclassified Pseudomonas]MBD8729936.1 hypothetical protein [Pseudomonas sp. CFBP 13710]MBD8825067.1 hypothetical protein [Pseudomonas sp. CFBP 13602]